MEPRVGMSRRRNNEEKQRVKELHKMLQEVSPRKLGRDDSRG